MVAVSDFSGLASSVCALARAPAIAPMLSLERGMTDLHVMKVEADRARFGALGPYPMPNRLLGILGHQLLELGFSGIVFGMCAAGLTKHACEFRPRIG